jgi:transglutaminase-like putative cysteine protease
MATLMMDAARVLGIAARFASGYLDCPASVAGRASMHAWTEVYLPALGWRGYDPTLGEATSLKHVTTGVSNHPRGVMPVSGMFVGVSSDYREMIVQVTTEKLPSDTPDQDGRAI